MYAKSDSGYSFACWQPQYRWLVQQSGFEHEHLVVVREWFGCVETESEFRQFHGESEHEFAVERLLGAVRQGLGAAGVSVWMPLPDYMDIAYGRQAPT